MSSKSCHACRQELSREARRCHHCHAWQGKQAWLGELTVSSIFSLIGTLVAICIGFINIAEISSNKDRIDVLQKPYEFAFNRWKEENAEFIQKTGEPGKLVTPISILWYQFFEKGYILYNASQGWSIVLDFSNKTWQKVENDSESLISLYNKEKIDISRLRELHGGVRYNDYLDLLREGKITGGIGNLYVKHDLGLRLGKPRKAEMWIENSGFVNGENYNLMVGIINRHTDSHDSIVRTVYALLKNNTYKRFVVVNRPSN